MSDDDLPEGVDDDPFFNDDFTDLDEEFEKKENKVKNKNKKQKKKSPLTDGDDNEQVIRIIQFQFTSKKLINPIFKNLLQ